MRLYSLLKFIFCPIFVTLFVSIYSTPVPDLTIIGFLEPEGGLGKLPISILECLGKDISANFIATDKQSSSRRDVSDLTVRALVNSDNRPGKVSLLTDMLCDVCRNPSDIVPQKSIVKLAYSMLESTRIPSIWVEALNKKFDAVVVPDEFLVKVYQDSGVKIPVFVLPIPMLLEAYKKRPVHSYNPGKPFLFADASANKNPRVLLEAFARAFKNNPDVHLVMRAGHIDNVAEKAINETISKHSMTNVTVEQGHLSLEEYIERLSSYDCYVNLSRGEGFSFIPREALALGVPVIITNNTASKTICKSGYVCAVPCPKQGPSNWVYKVLFNDDCGEQFDCSINAAKNALLDVYNNYASYIDKARQGREWVDQYDRDNPKLQKMYRTLIKPKSVVLSDRNTIENGVLYTNSKSLHRKYSKIVSGQ